MTNIINSLVTDESGFIVSAELILIATIAVLGVVVGLSEVALNVNNELEDVGSAFGAMNQSFCLSGQMGHQATIHGTDFRDSVDFCDSANDITSIGGTGESGNGYGY